jgi:hypothetical protein
MIRCLIAWVVDGEILWTAERLLTEGQVFDYAAWGFELMADIDQPCLN